MTITKATEGDRIYLFSTLKYQNSIFNSNMSQFQKLPDTFNLNESVIHDIQNLKTSLLFIAKEKGQIIGYYFPVVKDGDGLLDVRKDYRSKGVGSALVGYFKSSKQFQKIKQWKIQAADNSEKFWEKQGFQKDIQVNPVTQNKQWLGRMKFKK